MIVANATKDNEEGIIKALQIGDIKKDGNYFQQIYYNYLAEELTSRGYAIQFSVDKLYERSSVISYKRLQYEAMQESIEYGVNHKWLKDEFSSLVTRGEIIEKEGAKFNLQSTKTFTTKKVKLEEIEIIEAINKMSQIKPINLDFKVLLKDDFNLSIEQNESVDNILKSQNRIMVFTGKAGTGKTTTLKEIQNGIIEAGYSNHIFAPTTGAVDTLRKDGFHNALTLQTFLTNKDLQNKTSDQVIMIDEAGLISVPRKVLLKGIYLKDMRN